jgi:Zn-dependent protease with chaperone function
MKPLKRSSQPRLYDRVETLAIAAGLPMPNIVVIDSPACNAFALGLAPSSATVAVTRGLLQMLDEHELEAVLAHEMTHVKNRDTRLLAVAVLCTAIIFRVASVNVVYFAQPGPQWIFLPMVAAKLFWSVLVLLGWCCIVAGACVVMVRLAISPAREFLADAGAIELTKNPKALISALKKMSGRDEAEHVDFATRAAMISPMRERWFSTHPSLADRVDALHRAMPSMVVSPAVAASPIFSSSAASTAQPAPNAFRLCHGGLVVMESDPEKKTNAFAEALLEGVPDLSFLMQAAFWRTLRLELAAVKPPTCVSHPYILVPAIVLNLAVMFVFFPSVFPLFTSPAPFHSTVDDSGKRPEDAVPRVPNTFHSPAMQLR